MKYLAITLGIAIGIIIALLIIIGGESKCLQTLGEVQNKVEPMTIERWLGNPYYDCPDGECFLNK